MKRAGDALGADEGEKRTRVGLSTEEIVALVEQREAARREKAYARADAIRSDLRSQGVELFDVEREWRASDGRRGATDGARGVESMARDTDVAAIVASIREREAARAQYNWSLADQIREGLRARGVELLDKEKVWRSADGKVGVLPGKLSEDQINGIVGMRERERAARNWDAADRLRDSLREAGVRLDDRTNSWSSDDGKSGYFGAAASSTAPAAHYAAPAAQAAAIAPAAGVSHCQPADLEIMVLVHQHEEAREPHTSSLHLLTTSHLPTPGSRTARTRWRHASRPCCCMATESALPAICRRARAATCWCRRGCARCSPAAAWRSTSTRGTGAPPTAAAGRCSTQI